MRYSTKYDIWYTVNERCGWKYPLSRLWKTSLGNSEKIVLQLNLVKLKIFSQRFSELTPKYVRQFMFCRIHMQSAFYRACRILWITFLTCVWNTWLKNVSIENWRCIDLFTYLYVLYIIQCKLALHFKILHVLDNSIHPLNGHLTH